MAQVSFTADTKLIQAIEQRSQPITCEQGRILFNQGDRPKGLHILKTGEAALVLKSDTGQIVMCHLALPSSILGLPAVIGNEPYTMSAFVRKDTELGFLPRDEFEAMMHADPSLYPCVLEILAADVRSIRQYVSEL